MGLESPDFEVLHFNSMPKPVKRALIKYVKGNDNIVVFDKLNNSYVVTTSSGEVMMTLSAEDERTQENKEAYAKQGEQRDADDPDEEKFTRPGTGAYELQAARNAKRTLGGGSFRSLTNKAVKLDADLAALLENSMGPVVEEVEESLKSEKRVQFNDDELVNIIRKHEVMPGHERLGTGAVRSILTRQGRPTKLGGMLPSEIRRGGAAILKGKAAYGELTARQRQMLEEVEKPQWKSFTSSMEAAERA
jgi:hypothetical protein